MNDVQQAWTLIRTDINLRKAFVRLDDLRLPDRAAAEARRDAILRGWSKPHHQNFEVQCYRPGTLKETLEAKGLELMLL